MAEARIGRVGTDGDRFPLVAFHVLPLDEVHLEVLPQNENAA